MQGGWPLLARGFAIGSIIGVICSSLWVVFVLWLDHTEAGQATCYSRALEIHPERFQDANKPVSLEVGARMGRPDMIVKTLVWPILFVCFTIHKATQWLSGVRPPHFPGVEGDAERRRWRILFGSSIGGAIVALLVVVFLMV